MTHPPPVDRLARAVRDIAGGMARRRSAHADAGARPDAVARLDALEREVQEMRSRVNALFFAVLAAGVAELVGRAVLR